MVTMVTPSEQKQLKEKHHHVPPPVSFAFGDGQVSELMGGAPPFHHSWW